MQNSHTAPKKKFSIKDLFSKCDQIRLNLRTWSRLLKKSLMENFIFCAVVNSSNYRLVSWDLMEENTIITFSIIEIFNSQINFIK